MNEDELRQAMAALEVYKAQLDSIVENMQLIQISLEELARAKETLIQYSKTAPESEILVPIGGSSFIYAKVATNTKALVGIGSGVTLEKSMDEAIKTVEERNLELMDSLKKLAEKRASIETDAARLSQAVDAEYQMLQQQQLESAKKK